MSSASNEVWNGLAEPWRIAFEEAWTSWQHGNYGVGAVLIEPATGVVVARGRNRVGQATLEPGLLSGNMMAHAEMNAFAALERFNAAGLHLYTTLEPCLMCAASAMQLKVAHVHYAADDEFYDGLAELWEAHPVTASRHPSRNGPFTGPQARLAQFGRLLPMVFTLQKFPGRQAAKLARDRHAELAELFDDWLASSTLDEFRNLPTAAHALSAIWTRLPDS